MRELRDPAGPLAPPAGRHDPGGRRGRRRGRRRVARLGRLPAHRRVHRRHHVPRPVRPAALGRPADQGAGDEHALDRGQLRRAGLDLPGRQPVRAPGLPAAGLRGDHPARDPVLRPVRAVDGLRGLPAVAHEGGLGPDRRQHRGGGPRPGAERPDRELGGADRRRRRRVVRLRGHRADQGAGPGRRDRGGARRDDRPGAAGPGDDAPAGQVELVGAEPARPRAPGRPPAHRGRSGGRRSDEPPSDAAVRRLARRAPCSRVARPRPSRRAAAPSSPTRPSPARP